MDLQSGRPPHPEAAGFWTWDELGRLLRALGFSGDLFGASPQAGQSKSSSHGRGGGGLTHEDALAAIDSHALDSGMEKTANWHSGPYNARALRAALVHVGQKRLTFDQVHMARVAFNLYESEEDHEGLVVRDPRTILRAVKMSGKAIAPVTLEAEIRRATGSTSTPIRLHLDEFFHLLGGAQDILSVQLQSPNAEGRDARHLFRLCDFEELLTPLDDRRDRALNAMATRQHGHAVVAAVQNGDGNVHEKSRLGHTVSELALTPHGAKSKHQGTSLHQRRPHTSAESTRPRSRDPQARSGERPRSSARGGADAPSSASHGQAHEGSFRDLVKQSNHMLQRARISSAGTEAMRARSAQRTRSAPVSQPLQRGWTGGLENMRLQISSHKGAGHEWDETFELMSLDGRSSPQKRPLDVGSAEVGFGRQLSKPPVVHNEDVLEHNSLMEDLKWDIHTATDEDMRRYSKTHSLSTRIGSAGSSRPQTAVPDLDGRGGGDAGGDGAQGGGSERAYKSVFERVAERQSSQDRVLKRRMSSGRLRSFDKEQDHWGKLAYEKNAAGQGEAGNSRLPVQLEEQSTEDDTTSNAGVVAGGALRRSSEDAARANDIQLRLERRQRNAWLDQLGKPTDKPLPMRDWAKPGKWAYK